ncbi:MAG: hypothetical protein ABI465_07100 [Ktedonobacteraceae bacterium]
MVRFSKLTSTGVLYYATLTLKHFNVGVYMHSSYQGDRLRFQGDRTGRPYYTRCGS